ncbi:MAG: preprotein translocase subunit YajC [Pseudoalteromonas tetraodonis]|jgi:preprotein translocase subunit YajC
MNFDMTNLLAYILAADPAPAPGFMQFLPIVLLVVMMYFLMIRPHRVRQKAMEAQRSAMKKGDKVISAGGIHGTVSNIKEGSIIVKVAENVKLEFQKSSITTVIPKGTAKSDEDLSNQPSSDAPLNG